MSFIVIATTSQILVDLSSFFVLCSLSRAEVPANPGLPEGQINISPPRVSQFRFPGGPP